LGLATGRAKRATKILTSNQQQIFKDLLELLPLLEARVMVQPNKADFDVRKVLKRKKVSRDRMALSEHGEFSILHQKMQNFQRRLFYRLYFQRRYNVLIENSKDSVTNNDSNTNIKNFNLTLANRCEPTAT
jgi:hypothetical protein